MRCYSFPSSHVGEVGGGVAAHRGARRILKAEGRVEGLYQVYTATDGADAGVV